MFGPAVLEPHLGREGTGRKCKRGDTCSRCEAAQGRKLGLTPLPPALDPKLDPGPVTWTKGGPGAKRGGAWTPRGKEGSRFQRPRGRGMGIIHLGGTVLPSLCHIGLRWTGVPALSAHR